MAADLNISHILQELCHPHSNGNQICCKIEDNNNNIDNTGRAGEPWLPPSIVTQIQEQECTHRSERSFKTQGKEDETKDPQGDPCNTPVSPKNSNSKKQTVKATPKPAVSTKSSVFEKWAAMDKANQRPLAKRQLSDFSQASTSRAVKKTWVKEEDQTKEKVQSCASQQDMRDDQMVLNQRGSRRKLQKELISNIEDFYRVDSHTISAGQEVRNMCHLICQLFEVLRI